MRCFRFALVLTGLGTGVELRPASSFAIMLNAVADIFRSYRGNYSRGGVASVSLRWRVGKGNDT